MSVVSYNILIIIILLLLSAFFSGSETALFSLTPLEKRRFQSNHTFVWKFIIKLLDKPRRTLITILVGNMVVNTALITIVTLTAMELFGPGGVGVTIAIFTLILVFVSELLPKVFAVRHNERFAFFCAVPLNLLAKIIFPVRWVLRWIADRILSFIVHEKQKQADLVSESELKALARIGEEEGALNSEEREMIQKLIGLGDRMVREIMIARTDLVAVDLSDGSANLIEMIQKFHHSYFPVYDESIDKLLGIISTQRFMLEKPDNPKDLIESVYHIPETKPIDELLHEFQKRKIKVAICVDEYGGTAGLVTMEDVLEEIFGEFYDEYSKEETLFRKIGEGQFIVHGKMGLHEIEEELGIVLESETSETISGWFMEKLGRIPSPYDCVKWEGIRFVIREMFHNRIMKVEIRKL